MNMKKMLILAVAAAVATTGMAATKVRVVANASDKAYPGWENAYTSVAEAVAALTAHGSSADMNEILIAPGTYSIAEKISVSYGLTRIRSAKLENVEEEDPENTILDGGGTTSIMQLPSSGYAYVSGLTFANGFVTNETANLSSYAAAIKVGGPYCSISNCVFRGNTSFNAGGTCINVSYKAGTIVSGCTFTNNTQTYTVTDLGYNAGVSGCAIRMYVADSTPSTEANYGKIENCYFADNKTSGKHIWGGVVWANYTTLDNCTFKDNEFTPVSLGNDELGGLSVLLSAGCGIKNCLFSGKAAYPGEQYILGSHLELTSADCIVSNCTFSGINGVMGEKQVGVVYVNQRGVKFIDCCFTNNVYDGNKSLSGTGLIYQRATATDMLLRNCLFGNNTITNRIAFITQETITSSPVGFTLENCTFFDRDFYKYNYHLGKINTQGSSTCTNYMVNCVFGARVGFEAQAIASNCCFKTPGDWYSNPGGNITTNNCFSVNAWDDFKFVDHANGDYHLQPKSPLCEKGMRLDWMTVGATDLDGNKRVHLLLPDIGCYESQYKPSGLALFIR